MRRVTYAAGNDGRHGRVDDASGDRFSALPSLDADSIAFVPIPRDEFERGGKDAVPRSYAAALRFARSRALDLTSRWTRRFANAGDAWLQHALMLELAGRIGDGTADNSAVAALERAEATPLSAADRTRIAVARTRLALRRGEFELAGRIARSALTAAASAPPDVRTIVLPLAALLGDVTRAEQLLVPAGSDASLPTVLVDSLQRFRLRAVLGACEGLTHSRDRIEQAVSRAFAPAERAVQRDRLLLPVYRDAVPCLGPALLRGFTPGPPIDEAYQALAAGDHIKARRVLAMVRDRRAGADVAAVTWDFMFAEAWALTEAGDAPTARQQILTALSDLGAMNPFTLDFPAQAAGLRRSIELLQRIDPGDAAGRVWQTRWSALATPNVPRQ
jgi:hypothetical protein